MDNLNIKNVELAFVSFLESLLPKILPGKNEHVIEYYEAVEELISSLTNSEQRMLIVMLDEIFSRVKEAYGLE